MYIARSLRPSRALASSFRPVTSFHTSSIRRAMSEDDRAKDHPERAQKIDEHKHDSINKAKNGNGQWKPELASSSEQSVAAEKDDKSMEQMQKEGAQKAEEGRQPSGSK